MKIRIKGNSIRIRVSKNEVSKLAIDGYLEEQVSFSNTKLIYALRSDDKIEGLKADFTGNKIVMYVPVVFTQEWPKNSVVGIHANMPVNEGEALYLLLEKDFACLDATSEDQSDNYDNPQKLC